MIVNQQYLLERLQLIFAGYHIEYNARKNSSIKYSNIPGSYVELDIWIPKLSICFEFQDPYHYVTTWYYQEDIQKRDATKQIIVLQKGLSLISIPCWWDGSIQQLKSTVHFQRPDLAEDLELKLDLNLELSSSVVPIPLNAPPSFFDSGEIPGVGELMLASFPVDSQFKQTMVNNTWWLGEKYDGIRFCWNSENKNFYTRTGRMMVLPSDYYQHAPGLFVDGEMWFGRKQFGATATLITNHFEYVQWHLLRMVVFDVPAYSVQHKRFEKRYALLLSGISSLNPNIIIACRVLCKNNAHLSVVVKGIIDNDGEGVILRKIRSLYERGRSTSLIKLKATFGDSEAIVTRRTDLILTLGLPTGQTFDVPADQVLSEAIPTVGQVVTFSYAKRDLNNLPIYPVIERIRLDLDWDDVLKSTPSEKKLNEYSQCVRFSLLPTSGWASSLRAHLIQFASARNCDPLNKEHWYNIAVDAFHQYQSSKKVLQKFQGSYFKTLKYLFPDIHFDKNNLPDTKQRKQFFIQYAARHSFDPLNPNNWYTVSKQAIMQEGGAKVIFWYNNNYSKAVLDLFPNIGLDKTKFASPPLWKHTRNRRKFFEEYALATGFDARDPNAWYNQKRKSIEAKKGANRVLMYHGDSVTRALLELFPDIGLDKSKFWSSSNVAHEEGGRRQFFERYAAANGFDPLSADEWYPRVSHVMAVKGATSIIAYHNESLAKALVDLFPDVQFNVSKFPKAPPWLLRLQQKKKNL